MRIADSVTRGLNFLSERQNKKPLPKVSYLKNRGRTLVKWIPTMLHDSGQSFPDDVDTDVRQHVHHRHEDLHLHPGELPRLPDVLRLQLLPHLLRTKVF